MPTCGSELPRMKIRNWRPFFWGGGTIVILERFPSIQHLTAYKPTKFGEEETLGHLGHVKLMQELALISFLAEAPQPMFAHHTLLTTDVTKRTHGPFSAAILLIELAYSRPRFCGNLNHINMNEL